MPCYCDSPNSKEEKIERVLVRMYFDIQPILTKKQIEKTHKLKLSMFPLEPIKQLCIICKILSVEQMKKIYADYWGLKWDNKTLLDWYRSHLEEDIKNNTNENEIKIAKDELERIK